MRYQIRTRWDRAQQPIADRLLRMVKSGVISERIARALLVRARIPPARLLGAGLQIDESSRVALWNFTARELHGASITVGSGSNIGATIVLERAGARVSIGSRTHVGGGTVLDCAESISIGDDVLVAFDVLFLDHDSHSLDFDKRRHDVAEWMHDLKNWTHVPIGPVRIEDKAWIGARAIVLSGVTVGEGSVIGAGSVVTRDVPPWSVAVGNPARVVRTMEPVK